MLKVSKKVKKVAQLLLKEQRIIQKNSDTFNNIYILYLDECRMVIRKTAMYNKKSAFLSALLLTWYYLKPIVVRIMNKV